MFPFNGAFSTENNWDNSEAACCNAYADEGDISLLEACDERIESQVCQKEVFETNSQVCDNVTLNRSVYMLGDIVKAIIYTNEDVESTPFRCCLAVNDFTENVNACDEEVTTYEDYEYNPDGPNGMRCTEISYS